MTIVLTEREKRLVIFIAAVFAVAVLGPYFGMQWVQQDLQQQRSLESNTRRQLDDYRIRLSGIEDEREAVRSNRENYLKWVSRGVVGQQDPVNWVKVMKAVQTERGFFPLSYQFEPESLEDPALSPFTAESSVNLRLWEMTAEMAMLHDLDMLVFLEELNKKISSFFFPVECNFSLLQTEFSLVNQQNMEASCRLVWISVEDPMSRVVGENAQEAQGAQGAQAQAAQTQ